MIHLPRPILLVVLALSLSQARAEEPDPPLQPIEGVPKAYWFVYEGNWPWGDQQEVAARNGLPIARISLDSCGDNHSSSACSHVILCRDGSAYRSDPDERGVVRFKGTVHLSDFGRLCLLIERLHFRRLPEDIRVQLGHGSHTTTEVVRVHRLGEKEPIENREFSGCGPIELFAIQSAIRSVAQRIDWQKQEIPAAKVDSNPKFTHAMLKALNGLSNLRELQLSGQWDMGSSAWKRMPNSGPQELVGLTHLESLDLVGLEVTDEDLKGFSRWAELKSLDLRLDLFSKGSTLGALQTVPRLAVLRVDWPPIEGAALAGLANFQRLREFKGYVPLIRPPDDPEFLKRCANVERLDLSSSTITAPLLDGIKGLQNLKSLRLREASLVEDAHLSELRGLKSLTQLDLSGVGNVASTMADLRALSSLKELDLSMNPLNAADLPALAQLSELEGLNLAKTGLPDLSLAAVGRLQKLKHLDLFWNEIGDSGIKEICKLRSLQSLRLARTLITDDSLGSLAALEHLSELDISATDVTDRGLKTLQSFPVLTSLSVSGPYVTDAGLKEIGKLTRLQRLILSGARITDEGLDSLGTLSNLKRLDLDATRITDRGLKRLRNLPALEELNLDATRVTDAGVTDLGQMKRLRVLTLSGSGFTDAGMYELSRSSELARLTLLGCRITSTGLSKLQSLPMLRALSIGPRSESIADPTTWAHDEAEE